ncbi:anti-sigma factor family protein [Leptothoe sp. PORK10 BA2]|uniref:anti-sigma factor family protein n=1 Tax=Leptothoe sp. PORK10 BA2 TaxID=3110254 RepID=UPI002B213BA4|nr:hypothetical protein [Leptothoe sp. PORK10 BA2]MEA5463063.1 hypothetical protein [Leptothoe sp. PORK10 BA2]
MSFDHASFDKSSSSGKVEPFDISSEQSDGNQLPAGETPEQRTEHLETYDEEERFELLSAYLDDEVTAAERQQVAQWLMDEPHTLQMYRRLLMLRQAIRTAPVQPQPSLQVPTPPKRVWRTLSSPTVHRVVIFAISIALISGLMQLTTVSGRQQLREAWQYIKSLPEGALLELASTSTKIHPEQTPGSTFSALESSPTPPWAKPSKI